MITILDCYTDEPAGLGVPPYLGTYPRYIYGKLLDEGKEVEYLTIDDLRFFVLYKGNLKEKMKTDIRVYNLTRKFEEIGKVLDNTQELIINLGVHTPGKYLSALPGTLHEVIKIIKGFKFKKVLTGPALYGTALEGGKFFETADMDNFNEIRPYKFSYKEIKKYSVLGSKIIEKIPDYRVLEMETGKGCTVGKCSFCTEPLKNRVEFRDVDDILEEMRELYDNGVRDFRIGKQTCFYSLPNAMKLLEGIENNFKDLRTLHIDNVNPLFVPTKKGIELTKKLVKVCTSGNVAAFGVESFDEKVSKANNLNCNAERAYEAIKIINKYGKEYGENGMPKFLPGLNILFGLIDESKKTHEENMKWLTKFLDEDLWLRRINIRQANIFEGTQLYEKAGNKFLRKNKKFYWKWRNEIRQKIDFEMLKKILPMGHVLKDVRMEVYDGNTTFGRQIGTYPLAVGVKGRLEIGKFYDVEVVGHMLRSITGKVV